MNYIELFAGAGGLSLGLKSLKYNLLFANELSPMAAETYAYNLLKNNLRKDPPEKNKTKWLSSNYDVTDMDSRLREDPRAVPAFTSSGCDFESALEFRKGLVVGSIISLNEWLRKNKDDLEFIKTGFGESGVDLVSGGPPCQSFSMAGMREYSNNRNILPWEFAKFVQMVQPKIALLENVTGILRAFNVSGKLHYAWFEVAKAFAKVGYIPLCMTVNAKSVGVPQNRPRFILIAVRQDVYGVLEKRLSAKEQEIFSASVSFYIKCNSNRKLELKDLSYFDVNSDSSSYDDTFLEPLTCYSNSQTTVEEAIDDLRQKDIPKSKYVEKINQLFKLAEETVSVTNHEKRNNKDHVRRRFKIYQHLNFASKEAVKEVKSILKSDADVLSDNTAREMLGKRYLKSGNEYTELQTKEELEEYLMRHRTKKQTQRSLKADKPAPAAMSIPDDACHYHEKEIRTLTVREMARIQSFPDSFIFRSKITTGGDQRRFEVPQYTQVGNAVPPLLGRALGICIRNLLDRNSQEAGIQ